MRRNCRTGSVWQRQGRYLLGLVGALILAAPAASQTQAEWPPQRTVAEEAEWTLFIDNDPGGVSDDQNYTGGVALAVSGDTARRLPLSLDPLLGGIDTLTGVSRAPSGALRPPSHAFEFGFASFTPDDITAPEPIEDDHPYACLPFVSSTRQYIERGADTAYLTTLMVGVLGTGLCEAVQRAAHDVVGSKEPKGWDNQISDGGEPTARWSVTRRSLLASRRLGGRSAKLIGSLGAAVGFTTGLRVGLKGRWGETGSRWSGEAPEHSEYAGVAVPGRGVAGAIRFWELGGTLRLRAYNALLQGQFRDSEVTFSRSELRPLVGEAWLGHTRSLGARYRIGIRLNVRSVEIRDSVQDTPIWLTLVLQRSP